MKYKEGEPCSHTGCLNHVTHPCEGCGRNKGMNKPKVILSYSLMVSCPVCHERFDIVDYDDDAVFSTAIFNNDWGLLRNEEVYCPACEADFQIKEVEY